jgi:subtilisin-like proprotein convertase family protein
MTYSNSTPVPIVDLATSNSLINVPSPGTNILDLNVLINLTHTWDSDLDISLIGPDGTRVLLSDNRGGSGDNFTNTVFDDSAATSISAGSAPFTGTFRPDQLLSGFNSRLSAGTWTLEVSDQAGGDIGTILNWSIFVSGAASAISDANGWALLDVESGPVSAVLQLPPVWQYTVPTDGTHSFTASAAPIFGRTYGTRLPPVAPTEIQLSSTSIPENSPVGTLVGTLSSVDANRGDTHTYSLVNGPGSADNGRFQIVGDQLFALETFDYEIDQSFSIRVASTDSTRMNCPWTST